MKNIKPVQHAEVGAWGKFVRNQTTAKKVEDFAEFVQENNSSINVEAINEFQNFIRADEKASNKAKLEQEKIEKKKLE